MSVNTSDVSKAQEKVLGSPQEPISIYEEPVSGVQGAGTADQPYDQGNQPEQAAGPGIEPPSGQTGKGTATEPYDQGNQPGRRSSQYPKARNSTDLVCREQTLHHRRAQQNKITKRQNLESKSSQWSQHHFKCSHNHVKWNHSTRTRTRTSTSGEEGRAKDVHNRPA